MNLRDGLGRAADAGQLALGALALAPAFRQAARWCPGWLHGTRHEPHGARGEAFVARTNALEKGVFLAKMLATQGARVRASPPCREAPQEGDELLFSGDLLFPGELGQDTLSPALRARIRRASALVLNLEGVLSERAQELAPLQTWRGLRQLLRYSRDPESDGWASRIDEPSLRAFAGGLPALALVVANNHTLDDGERGFSETIQRANTLGQVVGDARAEQGGILVPVGPHQVGLLALSYGHNRRGVPRGFHQHFDRVPYDLDRPRIAALISRLRQRGATHVVAILHWGYEHEHEPAAEQRRCARLLLDEGACAVVGHHPHLLQTSASSPRGAVFYSLGDFIGGDRTIWSRIGALASLQITRDGRVRASLIPTTQTPYWRRQRTGLLAEAPPLERLVYKAFFRWKNTTSERP